MTEAWKIIRAVKIEEPVYGSPATGGDQIVGIVAANKIIDALNAAGYVIVEKRYSQSPPTVYRVDGEPQEQSARRDAE